MSGQGFRSTLPHHETTLSPHILLVTALAGWMNREQQKVLDYLREENRILKEQLSGRRLRLSDRQRRQLAAKGKRIGRRLLDEFATIVTPDTISRWHRQLIAKKFTNRKGTGRPGVMKEIEDLVVRMGNDNPSWGYRRIEGALRNVGHRVAYNTVKRILRDHGIEPTPERTKRTTWAQFLRTHWSTIAAADFFTTETWAPRGLATIYTLFVIRLETRRVYIVGSTPNPNAEFMKQAALDLVGFDDSFLSDATHFVIDRDTKFTRPFRERLEDEGVTPVVLPPRSPNMNAYAERFVRSIKRMPRTHDLLRPTGARPSNPRVRRALPQRAKSPGSRQSTHRRSGSVAER